MPNLGVEKMGYEEKCDLALGAVVVLLVGGALFLGVLHSIKKAENQAVAAGVGGDWLYKQRGDTLFVIQRTKNGTVRRWAVPPYSVANEGAR